MSKLKITFLALIVCALTTGILFVLLFPRQVDIQPVSPEQVDAAFTLLRNSLASPRYTYTDFLSDNKPGYLMF